MDEYLTPQEAAAMLRISHLTMRDWRSQKRGPRYVLVEGQVRYPKSALQEFLQERTVDPKAAK